MHYYDHNIKDFNNATRHLTRVERSLYRDLIELYYDDEQPIDASSFDRLARKVQAHSNEEKEALQYILDEFFFLVDGVYRNTRCDREIENYRAVNSAKSKAGKASAESRRRKKEELEKAAKSTQPQQNSTHVPTSVNHMLNTCATNQEPVTSNYKPLSKKHNSESKDSGDSAENPTDHKKTVFDLGVSLLLSQGETERKARSFLGQMIKNHGPKRVAEVVAVATTNPPAEAKSYISKTLTKKTQSETEFEEFMREGI